MGVRFSSVTILKSGRRNGYIEIQDKQCHCIVTVVYFT